LKDQILIFLYNWVEVGKLIEPRELLMDISIPEPGNFGLRTTANISFTTYDVIIRNQNAGFSLILHFDPSNLQVRAEWDVNGDITTINSLPVTNFTVPGNFFTMIDQKNIFCFISNETGDNYSCLFAITCPSFADLASLFLPADIVNGVDLYQTYEKTSDFEAGFDSAANSNQAISYLLDHISPVQVVPIISVCNNYLPYSTQLTLAITLPFLFFFLVLFIVFACLYAEQTIREPVAY
jgi:hypothetical protein